MFRFAERKGKNPPRRILFNFIIFRSWFCLDGRISYRCSIPSQPSRKREGNFGVRELPYLFLNCVFSLCRDMLPRGTNYVREADISYRRYIVSQTYRMSNANISCLHSPFKISACKGQMIEFLCSCVFKSFGDIPVFQYRAFLNNADLNL